MTNNSDRILKLRLGMLLWSIGMLGVVAITATVLPQILNEMPFAAPPWLVTVASIGQSAMLFGAGHLPAAAMMAHGTAHLVSHIWGV